MIWFGSCWYDISLIPVSEICSARIVMSGAT
jgi:hypothetical protein